jgi:hypothetical protein
MLVILMRAKKYKPGAEGKLYEIPSHLNGKQEKANPES